MHVSVSRCILFMVLIVVVVDLMRVSVYSTAQYSTLLFFFFLLKFASVVYVVILLQYSTILSLSL